MAGEEVIELSVEETNKLRAELGLAPLRLSPKDTTRSKMEEGEEEEDGQLKDDAPAKNKAEEGEVLELSVDETNELRKKLGLAPLREKCSSIIHKPAENEGNLKAAAERVEQAKLKGEVEKGISATFSAKPLGQQDDDDDDKPKSKEDVFSWANKMRKQKKQSTKKTKAKKETEQQPAAGAYDENDLKGMNVSHAVSDLEAGSTTVLTLSDAPLLQVKDETSKKAIGLNEDSEMLENVALAEQASQQDGLRKKRQLELGLGRAGGYAGFDDDEFEELGGTQAHSRLASGSAGDKSSSRKSGRRGFQIGASFQEEDQEASDLFAAQEGKAISLESSTNNNTVSVVSDFMTEEEDEELREEKKKKKKKKEVKFKKKKKKSSKEKKKRKQQVDSDDDEEEKGEEEQEKSSSLLKDLEATAVANNPSTTGQKRSRSVDDEENEGEEKATEEESNVADPTSKEQASKRAKYDEIMAKGNARSKKAFQVDNSSEQTSPTLGDEEPDDAFLNMALAKARRLQRLREMNNGASAATASRGADAVVEAVKSSSLQPEETKSGGSGGEITFVVDDTREFTRALRAREEQSERQQARKKQAIKSEGEATQNKVKVEETVSNEVSTVKEEEEDAENMDIEELAKDMKPEAEEDDATAAAVGLDGTTGTTVGVGRGLSGVLSMLKQTGEITRKNAGKEELRGRAKDERTYEDYEAVDLSKVVHISENASEKDKEFARREIKLEYRDKHGRLLTRKEAFRDLCYQFHGYGSSKRKEEKRQQQIAREQAEARLASRHLAGDGAGAGTFGALKATQKATGKAFVVHKT